MSPKSMLRHDECISTLQDLAGGSFQKVLRETDASVASATVKRVVFCSGKVYYELRQARRERGQDEVALIRIEQLYPLASDDIRLLLEEYSEQVEVVWCQEEARNMGAWPMMDEWIGEILGGRPPRYVGRPVSAAPATGSSRRHQAEQARLIDEALSL
jgi:2-oxoglutarate dehydrogenase E1 component